MTGGGWWAADVVARQRMTKRDTRHTDTARHRIAAALATIDAALPGTIMVRHVRCGKANCACHADPPRLHGPYIQWTRKVDGKTVTKLLSEEQFERYQPWFDNARRLKQLVAELEAASLRALEAAEDWKHTS
ncbi:MAG: DUF6788 family protein [Acidimicrobiales bacterium]